MYFVGKFISLLSLVYLATIVFLTLPKVYKMHQSTIDQNLHQVKEQASSTVQRTISRVSSQSSVRPPKSLAILEPCFINLQVALCAGGPIKWWRSRRIACRFGSKRCERRDQLDGARSIEEGAVTFRNGHPLDGTHLHSSS